MKLNIAVLSGDGIGPEVTEQAVKALDAVAEYYLHDFVFKEALVGATAIEKTGTPLPKKTIAICKECDTVLFGAIGDPKFDNDPRTKIYPEQGLLGLRNELNLYANIRPVIVYNYLLNNSPLKPQNARGTNILIYRELSAGLFYGEKGFNENEQQAYDACTYTVAQIERIAHDAFKAAQGRKKKLTLVDKSNVLETSRLWRRTVMAMAKLYPNVAVELMYVDQAAAKIILNPKSFDVILTANLIGDFISEEASALVGSKGIMASASLGEKYSLFEPIHGSYPVATNKGIANPIGAILSAAMLLEHFNLLDEAEAIKRSITKAMELNLTTPDLNKQKPLSTEKIGDFIADYICNPDLTNFNIENIYLGQSTII
ncbi:3-isopropylmalate dehydrogenase [Aquimarina agarivorans]|uniref:3-isopropylmalate dehydrogenase n=1 Tax=Aquimarina agarivorans TaxID=980584 RepID=UPI000248E698|nr:3-isopropylmalate dehydrogenase [Aquimarina agarivorans]